jgi:hypothetical protein
VGNAATTPIQLLGGGADGNFTNISVSSVATFGAGTVSAPSITTSGDTNTGIYFPAADTIAFTEGGVEAMRIDSSGNAQIGTTSGSARLTLAVPSAASTARTALQLTDETQASVTFQLHTDLVRIATGGSDALAFDTNSAERMRIESGGTVLIGSTASAGFGPLQLGSTSATASSSTLQFLASSSSASYIQFGDATSGSAVFQGWVGYTHASDAMVFATSATERMRIDSSGNLLVGDTGSIVTSGRFRVLQTSTSGDYISRLQSNAASGPVGVSVYYSGSSPNGTGNVFLICEDSTTTRMTVRSNGGIANYSGNNVNLSDAREKTNISLASSYLNKICAIPVKTFNYIDQNLEEDGGLTLGVIAQDVQAVAPELVMESNWAAKDEPEKMRLSIYQTDLQYALMKSIQELKAELDSVKAELQTLKGN